jgi:hypothetical protein
MLWALVVLILVLWLLGWSVFSISSLIHLLLVVVVILVVYNLFFAGRGAPPP